MPLLINKDKQASWKDSRWISQENLKIDAFENDVYQSQFSTENPQEML